MSGFAENKFDVYFKNLQIENVKSFKGIHHVNFLHKEKNDYAKWTVILGNNNTGKTTLLRCLAGFEMELVDIDEKKYFGLKGGKSGVSDLIFNNNYNQQKLHPRKVSCNLFLKSEGRGILFNDIPNGILALEEKIEANRIFINLIDFDKDSFFNHFEVYSYDTSKINHDSVLDNQSLNEDSNGILGKGIVLNVEKWLVGLDYAFKSNAKGASERLKQVKEVITSDILPDIQNFRFTTIPEKSGFDSYIEFQTDYGWVRLKDLGYGYQATLAWVMDLAKRMFDRYPTSKNPLAEPAVVLVDEIDLHLHPEWQRKIISYLSNIFKNTQFIVTAHSPLVVQSAENVNLVMLEKDGDHINIRQQFGSFKGWTVDEILTELMGMDDKTMSDTYLDLMKQFDEALDEDNYEKVHSAYEGLDKILHPSSPQRKILRIQMSSLAPVEA